MKTKKEIDKSVNEKIRQWRMSAGAMSVMCDDVEHVVRNRFYKEVDVLNIK